MFAGIICIPVTSSGQSINSIETRIDRMEREMQTLSRSVYKGDVPPPQMGGGVDNKKTAAMEMRLNQLEEQLRRLTGMIEENSYRTRKLEEKINSKAAISSSGAGTSQSMNSVQKTPLNNATVNSPALTVDNTPYQLGTITNNKAATTTPAGLYDQAFSFLQVKDYASAQNAFDGFIEKYPDHSLVENSKYWLGETYYARGDYQSASRSFARAFKDHPEGQKAPDVLLKLAMSLKAQDMREEACLTLAEIGRRFPSSMSVLAKVEAETASYNCE